MSWGSWNVLYIFVSKRVGTLLVSTLILVLYEQRLKLAMELVEKDDAARDILHLPKPSLLDFKDISVKQILQREAANILFKLGLGEEPVHAAAKGIKRP